MLCPHCATENTSRYGKDKHGNQRYHCADCHRTFIERNNPLGAMRLPLEDAESCLKLLLEGVSVRSTERITGVHRDTICKLVLTVGRLCENFMKNLLVDIPVDDVQVDELWGFVHCKQKTRERKYPLRRDCGDAYCFLGIERNTKLILAWHVGRRHEPDTFAFAIKLRRATAGRYQLSTDGFAGYQMAVPEILGRSVDWGVIVKLYGSPVEQRRYSPPTIVHIKKSARTGNPDWDLICTSHVERVNLTLRMGIRRLTRLTNGFSKKWENHEAAHSLFFAAYNFIRVHSTLKTTPAVAAGLADHVWTVRELLERAAALAA